MFAVDWKSSVIGFCFIVEVEVEGGSLVLHGNGSLILHGDGSLVLRGDAGGVTIQEVDEGALVV